MLSAYNKESQSINIRYEHIAQALDSRKPNCN